MEIRPFRPEDAAALVELAAGCARGEADFVLNPYWENEAELFAEFERFAISPTDHVLVADAGEAEVVGLVGFLRRRGASAAGMFCPVVQRGERGRGIGGRLLRAAQQHGRERLGIELATAGIGTRNRAGYSLLTSHGFRPASQTFLMRCDAKPEATSPPLEGLELAVAGVSDADAILKIYRECGFEQRTPERMNQVLEDKRHEHAVARHDGRVVAFAELETHWPKRPWVAFVGVVGELRDRGVGTHLVSWALSRQFESGAVSGQLMLSPANRTALRAYEKVGFRRFRLIDVLEKEF